jgi:hypothetical protein
MTSEQRRVTAVSLGGSCFVIHHSCGLYPGSNGHSCFVIRHSFVIRASSFVILWSIAMPETPSTSSEREQELERVLADYLHAIESGQPPDREEWLRRHPDLASELRFFFRNRDDVERLAGPLKEQSSALPETIGPEGPAVDGVDSTVRYFGDYELVEEIARGGMGVV